MRLNNHNLKHIQKTITLQQDQQDCGVACLLSLIKYYGGVNTFDNLRKLSGTNITGTTLLGLYQAANQSGFTAEGYEADIAALLTHPDPCILHLLIDNTIQHYVVCYGVTQKDNELKFIIGDPSKGIEYLNKSELKKIWKSKTCLTLTPNESFKKESAINKEKILWLKQLVKDDATILSIAFALGIGIAILGLSMAIFSQRLIDDIIPQHNFLKLNLGVALLLVLLIIKEGLIVLRQLFLLRQSKDFNIRITTFFYDHLLHLPKPFFDTRKIGELSARLQDTGRIQNVITQLTGNVIIDLLIVIVSFIFIFIYSWQVGIICLCTMPFFYNLIYLKTKQIQDKQRAIMSNYATVESNYISSLQGIDSIKNFNKESLFATVNNSIYKHYQDSIVIFGKIKIKISFLVNVFASLFLCSILMYSSYQVINHHLKLGELMALLGMCSTLLPPVTNLALVFLPINEAKIAFDRMFEFTSVEKEIINAENNLPSNLSLQSINIQNLLFRFAGRSPILKDISLKIRRGESTAIIGENGCGKSTLLQLLQKNYDYEKGSIIINDRIDLKDISIVNWRKIVAAVPQQIHLFNTSVLENIAFEDASVKTEKVIDFLKEYGFIQFIESLPQSYFTLVGEEGINISGGQRQIIALARALYHQPQLLILDEATSAMDKDAERFVLQLLMKLKPKIAIILIAHKIENLQTICNEVYLFEKGFARSISLPSKEYVN
ncbi:peptidase domain-containing ABC transporter [Ferruginibacter sp. SUN002]|uniref:peptidase domain-containing ABC transporter n=1 Tax=Ferruginibacter sp. SUN002 TaxID=2937789 RepID=UPI003D359EBE